MAQRSAIQSYRDEDRLEQHLDNWARWKRQNPVAGLESAPGVSYSVTFDDLCAKMDVQLAVTMDQIIEDMGTHHPSLSMAIYWRYLGQVVRFPRDNAYVLLARAREYLRARLAGKGIY